jgi:hypothetical protein
MNSITSNTYHPLRLNILCHLFGSDFSSSKACGPPGQSLRRPEFFELPCKIRESSGPKIEASMLQSLLVAIGGLHQMIAIDTISAHCDIVWGEQKDLRKQLRVRLHPGTCNEYSVIMWRLANRYQLCELNHKSREFMAEGLKVICVLTTMNTIITIVLVKSLQDSDVWRVFYDFIDPFDALDHLVAEIRSSAD